MASPRRGGGGLMSEVPLWLRSPLPQLSLTHTIPPFLVSIPPYLVKNAPKLAASDQRLSQKSVTYVGHATSLWFPIIKSKVGNAGTKLSPIATQCIRRDSERKYSLQDAKLRQVLKCHLVPLAMVSSVFVTERCETHPHSRFLKT